VSRRRRSILILASATLLVVIGLWALWPVGRTFDAPTWNDEKQVKEGVRLAMADRIVARHMLSGKSRSDVIAMLGEPPKTGYFADWNLVYWLGPERGYMSIDSEWLVVRIDASERVSDYRIVRD
jgi:hypothetical protein